MLKRTGILLMTITLLCGIAGCGFKADENARTHGDNRDEYLIKNRNQANEYMDVQNAPDNEYTENGSQQMGSFESLDKQEDRKNVNISSREQAANYVEKTIQSKVKQIPGINGADVQLQGSTVRITIDTAKGNDQIALADKVKENIRLLYNYNVIVNFK